MPGIFQAFVVLARRISAAVVLFGLVGLKVKKYIFTYL